MRPGDEVRGLREALAAIAQGALDPKRVAAEALARNPSPCSLGWEAKTYDLVRCRTEALRDIARELVGAFDWEVPIIIERFAVVLSIRPREIVHLTPLFEWHEPDQAHRVHGLLAQSEDGTVQWVVDLHGGHWKRGLGQVIDVIVKWARARGVAP